MVFHFSQVLGMSEYDFHIAILNGIHLYMYIMCQLYSVIFHNHSSFFHSFYHFIKYNKFLHQVGLMKL